MRIRPFQRNDIQEMIELFRRTVHTVCRKDYSDAQLEAWAPKFIDPQVWEKRFKESYTYLVEEDGLVIGFANLEAKGYLDMFYVHAEWQGKGVGKLLLEQLELKAKSLGLHRISSDVSITARPFFETMGFKIDKEHIKERGGSLFKNYLMSKSI